MACGKPPYANEPPLKVLLKVPTAPPPTLPDDVIDDFSEDFKDFITSCLMKDDKQRPSATELLQHKWIKASKSLRVTQALVTAALPKLEQQRDAQRKMDEEEDEEWPQNDYKDEDDGDDYDNGSMVYGTMIMADDGNNGGGGGGGNQYDNQYGDDDEYGDYGGTMIMTDDQMNGAKQNGGGGYGNNNGYGNDNGYNDTNGYDDPYGQDDDGYGDGYGTMIMTEAPKDEPPKKTQMDANDLVSIFDGHPLINSIITLPDNPSKQDLLLINETLSQLYQHDLNKLKDYYQANIAFVQKRLKKMD
mmetsp:Transcript_66818/g.59922  ORF Transcript_66818/g.59922 Transcript_66818/m.59922 type:complete len:302 (-) Transcript_66818:89-994(-)